MTRATRLLFCLGTALALVTAACGSDHSSSITTTTTRPAAATAAGGDDTGPVLSGGITVAAAASLTEAYTEIGHRFEATHAGTKVTFTFDSSSTLAEQVIDGAPVDVFASADEAATAELVEAELVAGTPTTFARNELVIVTRPGNPSGITSLADLTDVGIVALCAKDVPCGKFATQVLDRAGVTIPESKVTRGQNVKATLTAVADGDAAAGIVYVTDAEAAGDAVDAVPIPAARNALAAYPISVLNAARNRDLARAFAAYVLSEDARAVLKRHGFLAPA